MVCCSFEGARLSGAGVYGARFTDCVFRKAILRGARLCDATFDHCDLREANLEGMELEGTVSFRRCALYGTIGQPHWGAIRDGKPVPGQAVFEAPDLSPDFDGSRIVDPALVASTWGRMK